MKRLLLAVLLLAGCQSQVKQVKVPVYVMPQAPDELMSTPRLDFPVFTDSSNPDAIVCMDEVAKLRLLEIVLELKSREGAWRRWYEAGKSE